MSKGIKIEVWWNGEDQSKIRVPLDGTKVTLYRYYNHDEGWTSDTDQYWVEDDHVYNEFINDGCDCDGPLTRERISRAPIIQEGRRVLLGDWEKVSSFQRDVYAERMGY